MRSHTKAFVRSQHEQPLTHLMVQASLHQQPWGQWLFCVAGPRSQKHQAFCVGWGGKTHAPVGAPIVSNALHELIAIDDGGCALHLTQAMACVVSGDGVDEPCTQPKIQLRQGQLARIRCGAFSFTATWQAPPLVVARPPRRTLRSLWPEALAILLMLSTLIVLWMVPPDPMALSIWRLDRTIHMPNTTTIPPLPLPEAAVLSEPHAPSHTQARGRSTARVVNKTTRASANPRQPTSKAPAQAGMLEVLSVLGRSKGVVRTLFASGDGLGGVLDGLSTADVALGDHTGGLGVFLDSGPAPATLGDANFHTVGECPPGKTCVGGRNVATIGRLREHRPRAPMVMTPCESGNPLCAAHGALDKELVRREIRKHISEIKYCYEQQLVRAPSLSGRVAVRFVIVPTGAVAASSIAESSLGDTRVEACVANAVKRWQFPVAKQAGTTIVTYPFSFSPAGG